MNWKTLREELIEEYYPEDEELEKIRKKYSEISNFIQKEFDLETHFAGSASRATCMKGDRDIDIFVLFPEGTEKAELEDRGLEIGKAVFEEFNGRHNIDYAEHPYTKGEIGDHEVEIVPCVNTDPDDIHSSVDRTPHHSRWVENNLSDQQREDVVLLKKFLKAEGIYGSSLKTQGFSGYVCEVLIAHYDSFKNLTESAQDWREKQVIDPENHHEGDIPNQLRGKFKNENFVVIDPVDPERNAASVISEENFARFIHLCWRFNKNTGKEYFKEKEKEYTEFQLKQELKKRKDFLVMKFRKPDEVDDIIYPQMRKTKRRIKDELEKKDFRVFEDGFHVGEKDIRIFFELERELPEVEEQRGPKPFHGADHLEEFSSKYQNTYVKGDRLLAKTEREFTDAKELLQDFLSENLESKGIPDRIAEQMEDYRFVDPLDSGQEWLNYLGEKFHIQNN